MARIEQGSNLFESMRIILPEHREMMQTQKGEGMLAKSSARETILEWRHKYLDEAKLYEAGELLDQAKEEGFGVAITFASKAGPRTVTGRVSGMRETTQDVVIEGCQGVVYVRVADLMRVERA